MKKLAIPLVALVVVAVIAAGCGGESSKNKAYVNSVQGYANALNSICAPAEAKVKALGATGIQGIAVHGSTIKGLISDAVDKMDKLEPPSQVKSTAQDFISK